MFAASAVIQPSLITPFCVCDLMVGLLLSGATLLMFALYFVRKLTNELNRGIYNKSWKLLGIFIVMFIMGYLGFFVMKRGAHYSQSEMLVPVIFFLGAVFVLVVCFLSYRTTRELKRIYILEQETITDPLLGIFNRRCLDRRLREEVLRAQRHELDLSLMLVDIDHFKRVNDTWGHQIGDLVLKNLTGVLVNTLRKTDVIARFGGEEFVVLLPHTPEPEAYHLAEKVRSAVETTPLLHGQYDGTTESKPLLVTVSIGTACLMRGDNNAEALLERADKAMYKAKQTGRNRVIRCQKHQH